MVVIPACVSHLQDEGEAAGGLVGVNQADYVGVMEPLEQVELLSHAVSPHQLLVDVLDGHRALGATLVATLDHREAPPGGRRRRCRSFMYIYEISNTYFVLVSSLVTCPVQQPQCSETQSCPSSSL